MSLPSALDLWCQSVRAQRVGTRTRTGFPAGQSPVAPVPNAGFYLARTYFATIPLAEGRFVAATRFGLAVWQVPW